MNRVLDPQASNTARAADYTTPQLKRLGAATELTKQRAMNGEMDGGANKSRTG